MKLSWANITAVVFVVAAVVAGCLLWVHARNNKEMERLFRVATFADPAGSNEQIGAVKRLASFPNRRAGNMLLDIALGEYPNVGIWSEPRLTAIRLVAERNDDYASELAVLLQPYQDWDLRKAVADGLSKTACNNRCLAAVLHYKERLWHGELTLADRLPPAPDEVGIQVQQENAALEAELDKVLLRDKNRTVGLLASVYGLGSAAPSPFALSLTGRLSLDSACPLLIASQKRGKLFRGYREPSELEHAISTLQCQ